MQEQIAGFEQVKRTNQFGAEYWSARDLQSLLGYSQWRRFEQAIERARIACQQSGNDPEQHFIQVSLQSPVGGGGTREIVDYYLSRFACYLIAQNGDPRKSEIANAQSYFAVQSRRMEIEDELGPERERLALRRQAAEEFKALSGAARYAGVQNAMFGIFHDAGYKGLYGGLGSGAIKKSKGIPDRENLLDRMDTTELAANQFRMTQAREKLAREETRNQQRAIETHEQVGREVRAAIERIGGVMPEQISPAPHIREIERRIRSAKPRLQLSPEDAAGLGNSHPDDLEDQEHTHPL